MEHLELPDPRFQVKAAGPGSTSILYIYIYIKSTKHLYIQSHHVILLLLLLLLLLLFNYLQIPMIWFIYLSINIYFKSHCF